MKELKLGLLALSVYVGTVAFAVLVLEDCAHGEPWLSNRFAQNCIGCHDTGRPNRPFLDRRCTLSCQGCHVSPQGGGMRSLYGKWNEDKWLTMARSDKEPGKEATFMKKILNTKDFEKEVPDGDPYWGYHGRPATWLNMNAQRLEAGGDIRYLYPASDADPFMMSVALGTRWKPFRHFSLVMEPLFEGRPGTEFLWDMRPSTGTAYMLVTDMPANTYVQAGQYRPLFGMYSPDHTSVPQKLFAEATTGIPRSQGLVFRTTSVGTAPNVPYINAHYIEGDARTLSNPDRKSREGWAGNVGLRFVSLGLSLQYSFWDTEERDDFEEATAMHAFDLGAQLWRTTLNYYYLTVDRQGTGAFTAESHHVESRLRLWRELYVEYFRTEWTRDGEEQEPDQSWGIRVFPYPGWDLQLTQKDEGWMGQLHLFF